MAKTRMNSGHREILRKFAEKKIDEVIDRKQEKKLLKKIIDATNKAVREKYCEEEMAVLRKYDYGFIDRCIKYVFSTGRIDGIKFESEEGLVDRPNRNCYSHELYLMTDEFEAIFEEYKKIKLENDDTYKQKRRDCETLITFAKYVEDVLEVMKVPKDIEYSLTAKSTALVALSPDIIARLQKDFSS